MKNYFMGIDVGSTTIKIYITDQDDNCIYSKYERHYSDIQATIKTLFNDVKEKFNMEIKKLSTIPTFSPEYSTIKDYLTWLVSLPWNKNDQVRHDIKKAEEILVN